MAGLPAGTVSFLFSDVEGSTLLLEQYPQSYRDAIARHHTLLRDAVQAHDGVVFETVGDAVYAAFARPTDAVAAAVAGQCALHAEPWGAVGSLTVRMGVHTGEVERQDDHYFGAPLYRCARLMATAHGGQIVLSAAVADLVCDDLPEGAALCDLGEHRLKDLARPEHIFQVIVPALPADFPPLRTLDALPTNLPAQPTSFIGREREIAEVTRLLESARLLTLTGSGGAGKTRLALQVAAGAADSYADGVWLVELASLANPALVPQALSAVLGVREVSGRTVTESVVEFLRPRHILLVLDNCEHLIAACRALADSLLRNCPRVRLLCTSREILCIDGETTWRVPSLSLPDQERPTPLDQIAHCEAVRLFVERASAVQPSFALTPANAPALAQVCYHLDGIPLAIELAAARTRVLSVEQIAARLNDRFRLLTGGSRAALPRQQTLRALIDWSHDALGPHEQALLRRLAVFAGGWTLEAAEAVCAAPPLEPAGVLDLLSELVDKSLIIAEDQQGAMRYRLLETLRQYGDEKLQASGEAASVRQRHLEWCVMFSGRAELDVHGPAQVSVLAHLEVEHDNLRAALSWGLGEEPPLAAQDDAPRAASVARGPQASGEQRIQASGKRIEAGVRLASALWWFWWVRIYHREGMAWLEQALARSQGEDTMARAKLLLGAGMMAHGLCDSARAQSSIEHGASIYRAAGDKRATSFALSLLGLVARPLNYERGTAWLDESLALAREAGGSWAIAHALLWDLYSLDVRRDDERARAQAVGEESLALLHEAGDIWGIAIAHAILGRIALRGREYERAMAALSAGLPALRAVGDREGVAWALSDLGDIAHEQGDDDRASALYDESLALMRGLDAGSLQIPRLVRRLGEVALDRGDTVLARARFMDCLAAARKAGGQEELAAVLEALGGLAAVQGQPVHALHLAGAAAALRQRLDQPLSPHEQAALARRLAPAQHALDAQAQAAALRQGRDLPLEQIIAVDGQEPER